MVLEDEAGSAVSGEPLGNVVVVAKPLDHIRRAVYMDVEHGLQLASTQYRPDVASAARRLPTLNLTLNVRFR